MPCHTMLCHATLCYAMPCCAISCHAMLCCAMLGYATLCCAMLCCAGLRNTMRHAAMCCAMLGIIAFKHWACMLPELSVDAGGHYTVDMEGAHRVADVSGMQHCLHQQHPIFLLLYQEGACSADEPVSFLGEVVHCLSAMHCPCDNVISCWTYTCACEGQLLFIHSSGSLTCPASINSLTHTLQTDAQWGKA